MKPVYKILLGFTVVFVLLLDIYMYKLSKDIEKLTEDLKQQSTNLDTVERTIKKYK